MMKDYLDYIKNLNFSFIPLFVLLVSGCEQNELGLSTSLLEGTGLDCYEESVLDSNPVVYFRFNEQSGASSVRDSGSSRNNPTVLNVDFGSPGVFDRNDNFSADFDGTASLNLGNHSYLQITGDQTIEMWIRPTTFGGRRNPFAKAYGGEGTMTLEPTGQINYYYGTNGGNGGPYQGIGSGASTTLNAWTHVVLVRDLSNMRVRWYFNGVEVLDRAANYAAATAGPNNMFIGEGYVSNFIGQIDEFALYDSALSAVDIADHYAKATNPCE